MWFTHYLGNKKEQKVLNYVYNQTNNKRMKIDLNFSLVDLDGKAIENANAGKLVASSLVQQSKGDALKFWDWAVALNKGEILDLDSSDQETFKNFVKDNENFAIIAKAQILHKLKKY